MKRQELQVALDQAYKEMRQRAYDPLGIRSNPWSLDGGIVTSLDRWADAVTEPNCSFS